MKNRSVFFTLVGLALATVVNAQITGPTATCQGINANYSFNNGVVYVPGAWVVTGGTLISSSAGGTQYNATVQWTTLGTGTLAFRARSGSSNIATLNVNTAAVPAAPVANSATLCGKGTITATPGSNGNTVRWYDGAGTLLATATTSPLTLATTTYTLRSFNTTTGCESTASISITVTINITPLAPSVSNTNLCASGTITATPGTNGQTVRWYNAATNGTLLTTSTTSPVTSSTTTYYITSLNTTTNCETDTRTAVTVTVNPVPAAPTVAGSGRFGAGTLALAATGAPAGSTYNWFNPANAMLGTGSNYSTPPVAISTTNYLYVNATSSAGCVSTPTWVSITIEPVASITSGNNRTTMGSNVTLDAGPGYSSYDWRNTANPSISLANTQALSTNVAGSYTVTVTKAGISGTSTSPSFAVVSQMEGMNMNYIVTNTVLVGTVTDANTIANLPVESVAQTVQYFDGLGRPIQTVGTQASPTKKDVVQTMVYDAFGREAKKYLPVITNSFDGRYKPGLIDANGNYANSAIFTNPYGNGLGDKIADDPRPYSETIFEPNPLNRADKDFGAGLDWYTNNKNIQHAYLVNVDGTAAGQERVIAWTIDGNSMPVRGTPAAGYILTGGYYATGQLSVKSTKDEQGNEVREYTDKEGRTVLKKVQAVAGAVLSNASQWAQTYYIYDDLGQLRFVLQPELSKAIHQNDTYNPSTTDLANFAFQYTYDARKRMATKQVPGADAVWMVYDQRDRLVLTQDGNQRSQNQWLFTKYDALNRPVLTGLYTHGAFATQSQMDALVSATNFFETYNGNTATHGYSNTVWPTTNLTVFTATYYDNYDFKNMVAGFNYMANDLAGQEPTEFGRVVGKPTGAKVNVLGTANYLYSVIYYDELYRTVQTIAQNHKGGTDRTTHVLDFAGKVLMSKTTHQVTGKPAIAITRRMQYDHAGRLTRVYHLIGSNPADEVLLTQNEYNEVGQLVDKKLHSKDNGSTFKQSVDYRYNIRGWMSSINNSSLVNDGVTNDDANDLFGMNLLYNTVASGINNVADYTGNISALVWSNYLGQTGIKERGYKFDYDALNRLSAATHVEKTATWATSTSLHEDNLTYDLNGNIKTLNRKGAAASGLDNMVYNYGSGTTLSNKVLSITDNGDKTKGFLDQNTTGNDYTYDNNGSQLTDKNKGITATVYNHFNQPTRVTIANGDYMTYVYDGEGKRLGKGLYTSANLLKRQTDYVGDFVYENDTLKFIRTEQGRTMMTGASPEYQYELRDNKDNVRVLFTSKDETDAATATYEPANATVEQSKFLRYTNAKLVNSSFFDRTNGSAPTQTLGYAQRLNGSANEKYGLARSISVMPGDVISAEVYAKYVDPNSTNWNGALTTLMSNIASSAAGVVVDGVNYSTSTSSFPVSYPGLVTKTDTGAPKAYLNWLVFDRDFVFITGGFQQISTASREIGNDVAHERLASPNISISQPGYVYIYVSNENATPIDCYFDDLKVTQIKSPIVQTNTYYPFGLDIPSLSYGREGNKKNNYLYNGRSELQDDLGLNNYFTPLRIQETDAPRWWQVDPKVDDFYGWSPYNYAFNNPVINNDPNGDCPWCIGALVGAVTEYAVQVATNVVENGGHVNLESFTNVDVKSITLSAATGAAGVGIANGFSKLASLSKLTGTAAKVVKASADVAGDVTSSVVGSVIQGNEVTVEGVVADVAGGAVGRKIETNVKTKAQNTPEGKALQRDANRAERVNDGRASRQEKAKTASDKVSNHGSTKAAAAGGVGSNATSKIVNVVTNAVEKKKEPNKQ